MFHHFNIENRKKMLRTVFVDNNALLPSAGILCAVWTWLLAFRWGQP